MAKNNFKSGDVIIVVTGSFREPIRVDDDMANVINRYEVGYYRLVTEEEIKEHNRKIQEEIEKLKTKLI